MEEAMFTTSPRGSLEGAAAGRPVWRAGAGQYWSEMGGRGGLACPVQS